MTGVEVARVALGLVVQVPEAVLAQHLTASARVVAVELARSVRAVAEAEGLGYYPAVEYLRGRDDVDPTLLDAARDIAWFAGEWAGGEARRRLRGLFSTVTVEGVYALAFGMPAVRPRQRDAFKALVRHCTPDRVRLHLRVTVIHRNTGDAGLVSYARRQALQQLRDHFRDVEVVGANLL